MIEQQTAADIWNCYREIEAGEKLLADMEERKKEYPDDKHAQCLKDVFGRRRNLRLGIPSGEHSHTLIDVSPELAFSVIKSHIATKKAELVEINERARIELLPDVPSGVSLSQGIGYISIAPANPIASPPTNPLVPPDLKVNRIYAPLTNPNQSNANADTDTEI